MILDRTWNKKDQKLTISYIDKTGTRQFYQKYLHHIKTYEYDDNGDLETWNNRRCRKVFKDTTQYTPNEFDILEFLYELPKDINNILHAQNFPKLYTFDIETEISDEFPDPEKAEQALDMIEENDVVLILGKGHEDYQIIGHEKTHLDDAEEVRKYIESHK